MEGVLLRFFQQYVRRPYRIRFGETVSKMIFCLWWLTMFICTIIFWFPSAPSESYRYPYFAKQGCVGNVFFGSDMSWCHTYVSSFFSLSLTLIFSDEHSKWSANPVAGWYVWQLYFIKALWHCPIRVSGSPSDSWQNRIRHSTPPLSWILSEIYEFKITHNEPHNATEIYECTFSIHRRPPYLPPDSALLIFGLWFCGCSFNIPLSRLYFPSVARSDFLPRNFCDVFLAQCNTCFIMFDFFFVKEGSHHMNWSIHDVDDPSGLLLSCIGLRDIWQNLINGTDQMSLWTQISHATICYQLRFYRPNTAQNVCDLLHYGYYNHCQWASFIQFTLLSSHIILMCAHRFFQCRRNKILLLSSLFEDGQDVLMRVRNNSQRNLESILVFNTLNVWRSLLAPV